MRWPAVIVVALCAVPAFAEDIGQVLERSQRVRLDSLTVSDADSPRARLLRDSFDKVVDRLDLPRPVEFRVVRGELIGETLQGRVIVVNETLAAMPEPDRLFVLAHEIGHLALDHWAEMGALYRRWVPGEVLRRDTDAVAVPLSRDASQLAHRHEFQADAFALHTLRTLGWSDDDVLATFQHLGFRNDTATHPGTIKRMAALREAMRADARVANVAATLGASGQ